MPRIVKITRDGPYKIEPQDLRPIFICGCGLSKNLPLCDGSHRKCRDEGAESLFVYEGESRRAVESANPQDGTPTAP